MSRPVVRSIHRWWEDLLFLFYPRLCPACQQALPPDGALICVDCQFRLPHTLFHREAENPFTERFWGRIPLEAGAALFHFVKGGRTQRLIHELKYRGRRDIGYQLGKYYGYQLRETTGFREVDALVPVPLHPKKERRRGFNQSACFGEGLAESMEKPIWGQGLRRIAPTTTQTQKSRIERFQNVLEVFQVAAPDKLKGAHILLIDDVITTGATLEACALKLLALPGTRISMATLAIAE